MGHGLFAVDVLTGVAGVDDDALVPVIGDGGEDEIDIFAGQQFVIIARGEEVRVAGDFFGQGVAAIVQVGGSDTLGARQRKRVFEHPGAFHADADDAEAEAFSGRGR